MLGPKNRSGSDGQVDLNPHVTLRLPVRENREGWIGFLQKGKNMSSQWFEIRETRAFVVNSVQDSLEQFRSLNCLA